VSPSLEGVLNHDSLLYDGIKRPIEILRILDGPSAKGRESEARSKKKEEVEIVGPKRRRVGKNSELSESDFKILQEYFYDLYGVFMKRLSHFLVESDISSDDSIKLQAMLQEMIKVKKWVIGK
jgi:hypothetical protein